MACQKQLSCCNQAVYMHPAVHWRMITVTSCLFAISNRADGSSHRILDVKFVKHRMCILWLLPGRCNNPMPAVSSAGDAQPQPYSELIAQT